MDVDEGINSSAVSHSPVFDDGYAPRDLQQNGNTLLLSLGPLPSHHCMVIVNPHVFSPTLAMATLTRVSIMLLGSYHTFLIFHFSNFTFDIIQGLNVNR